MGEAPTTLQPEEDAPPTSRQKPGWPCANLHLCCHGNLCPPPPRCGVLSLSTAGPVNLLSGGLRALRAPDTPSSGGRREPDGKPPGSRWCRRTAGSSDFFSSAGKAPLLRFFLLHERYAYRTRRGRRKQQKDSPGSLGDSLNLRLVIGPRTGVGLTPRW